MIDTLTLKETFESNGFSTTQASTLSHAMHELTKNKDYLATKDELHQVRNELKNDIKEVREEIKDLRSQIGRLWDSLKDLKKEIAQDMEKLEDRIVHKLTYRALISQVSIGTILVKIGRAHV